MIQEPLIGDLSQNNGAIKSLIIVFIEIRAPSTALFRSFIQLYDLTHQGRLAPSLSTLESWWLWSFKVLI